MIPGNGITGPGDHPIAEERRCECGCLLGADGECPGCGERGEWDEWAEDNALPEEGR